MALQQHSIKKSSDVYIQNIILSGFTLCSQQFKPRSRETHINQSQLAALVQKFERSKSAEYKKNIYVPALE